MSEYGPEFGYSLATGKLFCNFPAFQEWCEELLHRPILTHEFASKDVWAELRDEFEARARAAA